MSFKNEISSVRSLNRKRTNKIYLLAAIVAAIMIFVVDPYIVNSIWSLFPASISEWGKIIRFILWFPVISLTFVITTFILGVLKVLLFKNSF